MSTRAERQNEGFTLLELIIAIVLSAVVLLSASNLMINFGNFSTNLVKSEASLMGTTLGAFEYIIINITAANAVAINPDTVLNSISYPANCAAVSCIQIRVSPAGLGASASSDHSSDTVYTFWRSAVDSKLYESVNSAAGTAIADSINSLSFTHASTDLNRVNVVLEARTTSGANALVTKEHLETTVTMRSRSAN